MFHRSRHFIRIIDAISKSCITGNHKRLNFKLQIFMTPEALSFIISIIFSKLYTRNKHEIWTSCFVAVGIVSLFENCKTYIFGKYSSHSGLKRASKGRIGINSRTDSLNIQNLSLNLTQYAAVCKGRPFGWRKAEAGGRKGEHLRSAGQVPAVITQMSDVIKGRPCALKLCVPSAVTFIVQLSTS